MRLSNRSATSQITSKLVSLFGREEVTNIQTSSHILAFTILLCDLYVFFYFNTNTNLSALYIEFRPFFQNIPILIEIYQWGAILYSCTVVLMFFILAVFCFFVHTNCMIAGGVLCILIICDVLCKYLALSFYGSPPPPPLVIVG